MKIGLFKFGCKRYEVTAIAYLLLFPKYIGLHWNQMKILFLTISAAKLTFTIKTLPFFFQFPKLVRTE